MNKSAVRKTLLGVFFITIMALTSFLIILNNQINDLENRKNTLQNQNVELQDQAKSFQNQIGQLLGNVSELQSQVNGLREQIGNHTNKLIIVDFSSPEGWFNPVGVTMAITFNLTILNVGLNPVEGFTLEIKRTNFDMDPFNCSRTFNILQAGEMQKTQESIIIGMDRYFSEFYTSSFVATIKVGGNVLNEQTLQITKRQF